MLRIVGVFLLLVFGANAQDEFESVESQEGFEIAYKNQPRTECTSANPSKVVFNLYTRGNPFEAEILRVNDYDDESIARFAHYNAKKPTKFLIHGYMQSANETRAMVLDYLYASDVNVIVIDWSEYAKKCNLDSTQNVILPTVAPAVSKMMKKLIAYGSVAEENFHVVAFGVGAHIAAQAAKKLLPIRLNRISALDPVGYIFDQPGRRKLQYSDAFFVDVFYTSRPNLASVRDIGHVNFYPNGGKHPQPGCTDEQHICSSRVSYELWQKSILNPLKAWKCDSYLLYKQGHCSSTAYVGEQVSRDTRGNFFVDIAPSYLSYD